jgi:hypothetical protein
MGRKAKQRKKALKQRARRDREIRLFQTAIRPLQDDTSRRVEAEIRSRLSDFPTLQTWHNRIWPVGDCELTATALKRDMVTPSLSLVTMPQIGRHLFNVIDGQAVNLNLGRVGVVPLETYLEANDAGHVYTATGYIEELFAIALASLENPDSVDPFVADALLCKAFGCPSQF